MRPFHSASVLLLFPFSLSNVIHGHEQSVMCLLPFTVLLGSTALLQFVQAQESSRQTRDNVLNGENL